MKTRSKYTIKSKKKHKRGRKLDNKLDRDDTIDIQEANRQIVFEARRLQTIFTQIKNKLYLERTLTEEAGDEYKRKALYHLFQYNHYYPELGKNMADYIAYLKSEDKIKHLGLELVYDVAGNNNLTSPNKVMLTLRYKNGPEKKLVEITRDYNITVYYENLPWLTGKSVTSEEFKKISYPERTPENEKKSEECTMLFKNICLAAQRTGNVLSRFLMIKESDYGLESVKSTQAYVDYFDEHPHLGLLLLANRSNKGMKETNFSHMLYDLRRAIPLVKWMKSDEIEIYQDGELTEKYKEGMLIAKYQGGCPVASYQPENRLSADDYRLKRDIKVHENTTYPSSVKFKTPSHSIMNWQEKIATTSLTEPHENEKSSYVSTYSFFAKSKRTNIEPRSPAKKENETNSKVKKFSKQTPLSNEEMLSQLSIEAEDIYKTDYQHLDISSYLSDDDFLINNTQNGVYNLYESDPDVEDNPGETFKNTL